MKFKLLVFVFSFLSISNINCMTFHDARDAIYLGNMNILLQYLNEGHDVNSGIQGITLLHHAALTGMKDIAEMLILRGADVNVVDASNRTPLHYAAIYNNPETTELLIRYKADPRLRNAIGTKASDYSTNQVIKDLLNAAELELDKKEAEEQSKSSAADGEKKGA